LPSRISCICGAHRPQSRCSRRSRGAAAPAPLGFYIAPHDSERLHPVDVAAAGPGVVGAPGRPDSVTHSPERSASSCGRDSGVPLRPAARGRPRRHPRPPRGRDHSESWGAILGGAPRTPPQSASAVARSCAACQSGRRTPPDPHTFTSPVAADAWLPRDQRELGKTLFRRSPGGSGG